MITSTDDQHEDPPTLVPAGNAGTSDEGAMVLEVGLESAGR